MKYNFNTFKQVFLREILTNIVEMNKQISMNTNTYTYINTYAIENSKFIDWLLLKMIVSRITWAWPGPPGSRWSHRGRRCLAGRGRCSRLGHSGGSWWPWERILRIERQTRRAQLSFRLLASLVTGSRRHQRNTNFLSTSQLVKKIWTIFRLQ